MTDDYSDIDKLTANQNAMLDKSLEQQKDIINQQTNLDIAELERNKAEVDKDVNRTNKALYSEYKKASNPYGENAENLASRGLGNSGYAETTQANLYNTFQNNITNTLNNARELKSNFDFEISRARQTGDITLAKSAYEIYLQKMNLLSQEYELKNNREQFLYQKEQDALAQDNWLKEFNRQQQRDAISDKQWLDTFDYNKERNAVADQQWLDTFNYNKGRDAISDQQWLDTFNYNKERDAISNNQWQQTFDYQKSRDAVADSQWQKQYELSEKATASSRKSSSSKSSTTTSALKVDDNNKTVDLSDNAKKYLERMQYLSTLDGTTAEGMREGILQQVNKGNISSDEGNYIWNKLNLG